MMHGMKRSARLPFVLALVVVIGSLRAADAPLHFLQPAAIDFKAILPPPPAAGTLGALGDLESVLQAQAARTPAEIAWAKFVERDNVFNHASVLGAWFSKEKLPATEQFLREVSDDMYTVSRGAKGLFPRPRPFLVDASIKPCVDRPDSGSYPSGHSMQAFVWAMVLGDIFPEQQSALLARAHEAAWGRVMGGVHFPTDLVGGRLLAEAIVAELRKNPAYQAGVEKCRAEAAPFLMKKAA